MNAFFFSAFRTLNRGLCWTFDTIVILLGLCLLCAGGAVTLAGFAALGAVGLAAWVLYNGWQFVRR
jgi:hypothetical protein